MDPQRLETQREIVRDLMNDSVNPGAYFLADLYRVLTLYVDGGWVTSDVEDDLSRFAFTNSVAVFRVAFAGNAELPEPLTAISSDLSLFATGEVWPIEDVDGACELAHDLHSWHQRKVQDDGREPVPLVVPSADPVLRSNYESSFSRAIPTAAAIREVAAHSPVVSYWAGPGYWEALAEAAGARVFPYDPYQFLSYAIHRRWRSVERGGIDALRHHPDCALMLIKPPLAGRAAARALLAYRGNTFIHVSGAVGPALSRLLDQGWELVRRIELPSWTPGPTDALCVYRRLPGGVNR